MRDYSSFIAAAYALATIVIGLTTLKIIVDYRALKRRIAKVEQAGGAHER